ncbi:MAG: flagellar hook-length control protein FliK [Ectothiorhodospiraceae bacterium]|nr:flagellar hook-length control protein FliK [Ectothiorhodospiraceae bacterium]
MLTPPGNRSSHQPLGTSAQPPERGWRVGQVLQALVREPTAGGQTRLAIGNRVITLDGIAQLPPGERLRVRVESLAPQLRLQLLPRSSPDGTSRPDALRELLPRQQGVNGLLAGAAMVRSDPARLQALPAGVRDALGELWNRLPDAARVQHPEGLRQALQNSGLLFEQRLAGIAHGLLPTNAVDGDMKGQLARLLNRMFQALTAPPNPLPAGERPPSGTGPGQPVRPVSISLPPPAQGTEMLAELARHTEGALARIQTLQINLLAADGGFPWWAEVPVRDGDETDVLQLGVNRDGDDSEGDQSWTVQLSFDFRDWGAVHCTITLQGGRVGTSWWAEQAATARLIDGHLHLLQERLGELGLTVGGMRCVHGSPPHPGSQPPTEGGGLIDERA